MRPRLARNRTLPPNLQYRRDGYYIYVESARSIKNPGRRHVLGRDRLRALQMAQDLNTALIPATDIVRSILEAPKGRHILLSAFLPQFLARQTELLEQGDISKGTFRQREWGTRHINAALGSKFVHAIETFDVVEFLNALKPSMRKQYRSYLTLIFQYAIGKGLRRDNPVREAEKTKYRVKRNRLSLKDFWAIHQQAEPWVQVAMELFLHTTQRPVDLVKLKFADFGAHVLVQQQKTGNRVRIKIGPALEDVIQRARTLTDDDGLVVVSEYVLHRIASVRSSERGQPLTVDWLSRNFRAARDASGIFAKIPEAERPTFYEIRSLGAWLYKQQGTDPQKVLGHDSKAMTELYLSRPRDDDDGDIMEFDGELKINNPNGGKYAASADN